VERGSRNLRVVSLAERLGYAADAKLLIVNCDDLGSTRSANIAVYEALRDGLATSATLMVPCPWARDAAAMYRGEDVGVHLTLNSEWDTYRWGPITHSPSLLDGDGGFPRTVEDVWDHADLDEVRRECRAQLDRAIYWGFDASHIDSHMGTMQLRPEFFDVYLEMAVDFQLPLRMAGASAERRIGFPYRRLAEEEGVVFPDHFIYTSVGSRRTIEKALFDLRAGVTEVYLHPGIDTDELRASHPDWSNRVEDHAYLTRDPSFRDLIERAGVTLIGYRELRELQRREMQAAGAPDHP
jgi:chitin disaccharide deacetylase